MEGERESGGGVFLGYYCFFYSVGRLLLYGY